MSKKAQPKDPQNLVVDYDLFELPTAQHKAGLVGLVMMIRSMETRKLPNTPELVTCAKNSVSISFTEENVQALFNDLYDAEIVEAKSQAKWSNHTLKRIDEIETVDVKGKKKLQKSFVNDVKPLGAFLKNYYPDDGGLWLKLWKDMVWETLRGVPKTRNPYKERSKKQNCSLGAKMWQDLSHAQESKKKGKIEINSLSSSLYIGGQEANAERIPFDGRVEHNLLLHFWTIVSLVFVPQLLARDGKISSIGYVLVIPEPNDVLSFIDDVTELLKTLEPLPDAVLRHRPASSLIHLPEEGGLEYLYWITRRRVERQEIAFSLANIEIYHLKQGRQYRVITSSRIVPDRGMLDLYEPLRKSYRNPLFKAQRLRNLLAGKRWYEGSEDLFHRHPWHSFVYSSTKTSPKLLFFGFDVHRTMESIEQDLKTLRGGPMTENDLTDAMARRIYSLMRSYVNCKTKEKTGVTYKDFKNEKNEQGHVNSLDNYREALQKVCADAFLAMRSRRGPDFIEYFVGSICSVPHFLPESEYLALSRALMTDWNQVKILAMLALSAHSYVRDDRNKKSGDSA